MNLNKMQLIRNLSPCGHRRRRKALTFEHPPPKRFYEKPKLFYEVQGPPWISDRKKMEYAYWHSSTNFI